MIEELRIKNFAIIDSLVVPLSKGFNVITGETGAGKSIIVDAIGILLKEKVPAVDFIKHGKNEANIEVIIYDTNEKESVFEDEALILKKILSIQGKTKTYINDSAFTVNEFVKIASRLINIHGQHEHTHLLKKENHILFFDTIAKLKQEVERFNQLYMDVQSLKQELEKISKEIALKKQRIELLQFQVAEIKNAKLKEGEEEELIEQRQILKNVLKLKELAESSFSLLYEDRNSVHTNLSKILNLLKELSKFDSKAEEVKSLIESALTQSEEAVYMLRKLKETYEPDPATLENIEERLTLINKLKIKYGSTIKEIIEYAKEAEKELNIISVSEEDLKTKENKLEKLLDEMISQANKLSAKRKSVKNKIEEEIINELKFLGFLHPLFEIKISEKELSLNGKDDVEFYFSSNPGEPPKPLIKIASGGELSRLMLALKCVELKLAKNSLKSMTLIFDEIDAGIGGTVAENIGRRLKELSNHHQVICVTHLPQIAAQAQHHLKVEKVILDNKTLVKIDVLTGIKRKEEIARMLSGRITESSIFHAEELLESK
ncbi:MULTISPECIES: DNA repair protein RecN [Thermodesulfovibrio]|jgi:DNA repair protein RecN (Recombination protein N)|uniref:DNA repair protein RecN n=1 Tax=Thermodesulfovibrio yellowstonii (strain ATCC 51303 / DSM 11347 / YP87) TaxID=289376 RepID=B5YKK3_THEYD|nr:MULTISPECIES: DNA repair protein RecN [Thermodesulfovibrio]ACI21599.1 DNA repair protein RecN [Thermodesulfovibrio yellowstonii DSM 11347]MDI6865652.1 DNA repair protein RecN [Thermodesulfovibrio yellowstonii]